MELRTCVRLLMPFDHPDESLKNMLYTSSTPDLVSWSAACNLLSLCIGVRVRVSVRVRVRVRVGGCWGACGGVWGCMWVCLGVWVQYLKWEVVCSVTNLHDVVLFKTAVGTSLLRWARTGGLQLKSRLRMGLFRRSRDLKPCRQYGGLKHRSCIRVVGYELQRWICNQLVTTRSSSRCFPVKIADLASIYIANPYGYLGEQLDSNERTIITQRGVSTG